MALVFDTGPVVASIDSSDRNYVACRELIRGLRERRVLPAPVIVEVSYFLRTRLSREAHNQFLRDLTVGAYAIEELVEQDYSRILELCEQYSDLDVGFVDAAVLAIVERLNEPKLATLDHRHFGVMRPRHVDSLQLLPA